MSYIRPPKAYCRSIGIDYNNGRSRRSTLDRSFVVRYRVYGRIVSMALILRHYLIQKDPIPTF